MTSKKTKPQKTFNYVPTVNLPKLKSIKTEWDLKKHFYKNERDPQIEKDLSICESDYARFVKKYHGKDFVSTTKKLKTSLEDYLALEKTLGHKPAFYFSYRLALNSSDIVARKHLNQIEARLTKLGNTILFYELTLGRIPAVLQKAYLKDASLALHHFYLKGIFETAKYTLSEAEEKIMSLKSQTACDMWVTGTEKILGATNITYKGKHVPLNAAMMQFMDLPKKDRHIMWSACVKSLEQLGPIAENELNAVVTDKKTNDELRGFKKPYSATVIDYDQNEASLEALVDIITTKGYALSRKFFTHKAKLAGTKLEYIDRNDFEGSLPTVDFATATTICRDAFYNFNPIYGDIFDTMLTQGEIDVYSKPGKGGGAFCSSGTNLATVVLLNHNNDFQSINTFAHEMGHAVHAYRSKLQPLFYQDHSIVTAETASTFFEQVAGAELLKQLTGDHYLTMLNTQICDKINTIIMCIARYSAELDIHETIRREGAMTWQEMSACLAKHFRAFTGKSITVHDHDAYSVISKIHYRMNFYQYSYSFGNLASSIMFKRYQEDQHFATQVDIFLTAGNSANVDDIFRSIDIDVSKPHVLAEGLTLLETDINNFIAITT